MKAKHIITMSGILLLPLFVSAQDVATPSELYGKEVTVAENTQAYTFTDQDYYDLNYVKEQKKRWIVDYTTRDIATIQKGTVAAVRGLCNLEPGVKFDTYVIECGKSYYYLPASAVADNSLIEELGMKADREIQQIETWIGSVDEKISAADAELQDLQDKLALQISISLSEMQAEADSLSKILDELRLSYDLTYSKENEKGREALEKAKKNWEASLTSADRKVLSNIYLSYPRISSGWSSYKDVSIRIENLSKKDIVALAWSAFKVSGGELTTEHFFTAKQYRIAANDYEMPVWEDCYFPGVDDLVFSKMNVTYSDGSRMTVTAKQFNLIVAKPAFDDANVYTDHTESSAINERIRAVNEELSELNLRKSAANTNLSDVRKAKGSAFNSINAKLADLKSVKQSYNSRISLLRFSNTLGVVETNAFKSEPYRNFRREVYKVPIGMGFDVNLSGGLKPYRYECGLSAFFRLGNLYNRVNMDLGIGTSSFHRDFPPVEGDEEEIDNSSDDPDYNAWFFPVFARVYFNLLSHKATYYSNVNVFLYLEGDYNLSKSPYVPKVGAAAGFGVSFMGTELALFAQPSFLAAESPRPVVSDTRFGFRLSVNFLNGSWTGVPEVRRIR